MSHWFFKEYRYLVMLPVVGFVLLCFYGFITFNTTWLVDKSTADGAYDMAVRSYIRGDNKNYVHWVGIAANRGSVEAMMAYSGLLIGEHRPKAAIPFLIRARAKGDRQASCMLKEVHINNGLEGYSADFDRWVHECELSPYATSYR